MNIKQITYERNRNLGNYQSEKVCLTAEIDPMDDILDRFEELREIADKVLFPEKYLSIPEEKIEMDYFFMSDREVNQKVNEYKEPDDLPL